MGFFNKESNFVTHEEAKRQNVKKKRRQETIKYFQDQEKERKMLIRDNKIMGKANRQNRIAKSFSSRARVRLGRGVKTFFSGSKQYAKKSIQRGVTRKATGFIDRGVNKILRNNRNNRNIRSGFRGSRGRYNGYSNNRYSRGRSRNKSRSKGVNFW